MFNSPFGMRLGNTKNVLQRVVAEFNEKPILTIPDLKTKFAEYFAYFNEKFERPLKNFDVFKDIHDIPLRFFNKFTYDEICKLWFSIKHGLEGNLGYFFNCSAKEPCRTAFFRKIEMSLWKNGVTNTSWNDIVGWHNDICNFKITVFPEVDVRLNFTLYLNNDRGSAKFDPNRYKEGEKALYLDGSFAYELFLNGGHILTLGFSLIGGNDIGIRQIQSRIPRGNRFLYRITNKLEFVISLFHDNFPNRNIWVVDGSDLINRHLSDAKECYKSSVLDVKSSHDSNSHFVGYLKEYVDLYKAHIHELIGARPRVVAMLGNAGKFSLDNGNQKICGDDYRMRHYQACL